MHKLLEQDEIFSLQTDRVSSLAEVLRIQKLYPISLEPPPYHVLAHAAMTLLGPTAYALRLPALLGYLLMQFCLYFFVRNLVGTSILGRRAGLVAVLLRRRPPLRCLAGFIRRRRVVLAGRRAPRRAR
jgi:hypothetical protein